MVTLPLPFLNKFLASETKQFLWGVYEGFVITVIHFRDDSADSSSDESDSLVDLPSQVAKELENESSDHGLDLNEVLDSFSCAAITPEVENFVYHSVEDFRPLEVLYKGGAKLIKETICSADEKTECNSIHIVRHLTKTEDHHSLDPWTAVCYWYCCNGVKKVSSVIAGATLNLFQIYFNFRAFHSSLKNYLKGYDQSLLTDGDFINILDTLQNIFHKLRLDSKSFLSTK